jgi:hypothetical protein
MNRIAKIQSEYIRLLESYLDPLGKEAIKDHISAGNRYSTVPYLSDVLLAYYESLPDDIADFWKANAKELREAITEQNSLKLCYSGDLSPSNASNLVSKLGLYVDTVLIPDPVFNITHQLNQVTTRQFYLRSIIRHSLNIAKLKTILTADLETPIAAIFPSTNLYDPTFLDKARDEARKNTVAYLNETFDLRLTEREDPFEVMKTFKKPNELVDLIKKSDNLIPDLTEPSIPKAFNDFLVKEPAQYRGKIARLNAGEALCGYVFGRLMSFHDHFEICRKFGGEPIYDSPNSWKMFTWFLDDTFPQGNLLTNEGIVANSIGIKDPKWIGKLPDEKLIEVRAGGDLKDIRSVLTEGINRMKIAPSADLSEVTRKVQANLKEAFTEHQKEVSSIDKKLKLKYFITGPIIVAGSLVGYIPHPVAIGASVPFTLAGWYGMYRDTKKLEAGKEKGRIIGMMYDSED